MIAFVNKSIDSISNLVSLRDYFSFVKWLIDLKFRGNELRIFWRVVVNFGSVWIRISNSKSPSLVQQNSSTINILLALRNSKKIFFKKFSRLWFAIKKEVTSKKCIAKHLRIRFFIWKCSEEKTTEKFHVFLKKEKLSDRTLPKKNDEFQTIFQKRVQCATNLLCSVD